MAEGEGRKRMLFTSPIPLRKPERHEEKRWPSLTPLPMFQQKMSRAQVV